jgi:hypothetical protein
MEKINATVGDAVTEGGTNHGGVIEARNDELLQVQPAQHLGQEHEMDGVLEKPDEARGPAESKSPRFGP